MAKIKVLGAIRFEAMAKYREFLIKETEFEMTWAPSFDSLTQTLADKAKRIDVLVVDQTLGDVHTLIDELRKSYPQLLIILVDEEADFAMPGRADEISTEPFKDDQLIKLVKRVFEDRRLVTLKSDALPPVRQFAKKIMNAQKGPAKVQAAVEAIQELGFDYVAFYTVQGTEEKTMSVSAQAGDAQVTRIAPQKQDYNTSLVGWVAQNGQTRIVKKEDELNHPFVARGKFGRGVCVAVGSTIRFGVLMACQEKEDLNEQSALMLELISAQLASALAREARG